MSNIRTTEQLIIFLRAACGDGEDVERISERARQLERELATIKDAIKRCDITLCVDGGDMADHGWIQIRVANAEAAALRAEMAKLTQVDFNNAAIIDKLQDTITQSRAQVETLTKEKTRYYQLIEMWGVLYNTPPLLTGDEWTRAFNETFHATCQVLMTPEAYAREKANITACLGGSSRPSDDYLSNDLSLCEGELTKYRTRLAWLGNPSNVFSYSITTEGQVKVGDRYDHRFYDTMEQAIDAESTKKDPQP